MSRIDQLGGSVSPVLTKFVTGFRNPQFIADKVCPVVPTLTETGSIMGMGKDGFKLYETRREIGNPIPEAIPPDFSADTYQVAEEAILRKYDQRELEAAQNYGTAEVLKLKQRYLRICQNNVLMTREKAVADIVFGTSYYASGNKVTLSGSDQITDPSSDPLGVVDTGMAAARADMFIEPNIGVIGYTAWQKLKRHAQLVEIFKHVQKGLLTPALVAEAFELEELIVGKNGYATDTGVHTDLWGDYFALLYRPPVAEMVEGTTPHTVIIQQKGYPKAYQFPIERILHPVASQDMFTVKNVSTSYGYLISDLVA